jgi:hypothetical protein
MRSESVRCECLYLIYPHIWSFVSHFEVKSGDDLVVMVSPFAFDYCIDASVQETRCRKSELSKNSSGISPHALWGKKDCRADSKSMVRQQTHPVYFIVAKLIYRHTSDEHFRMTPSPAFP